MRSHDLTAYPIFHLLSRRLPASDSRYLHNNFCGFRRAFRVKLHKKYKTNDL
jgi:hypothetical protein